MPQNCWRILPAYTEGWKASSRYWVLETRKETTPSSSSSSAAATLHRKRASQGKLLGIKGNEASTRWLEKPDDLQIKMEVSSLFPLSLPCVLSKFKIRQIVWQGDTRICWCVSAGKCTMGNRSFGVLSYYKHRTGKVNQINFDYCSLISYN